MVLSMYAMDVINFISLTGILEFFDLYPSKVEGMEINRFGSYKLDDIATDIIIEAFTAASTTNDDGG